MESDIFELLAKTLVAEQIARTNNAKVNFIQFFVKNLNIRSTSSIITLIINLYITLY